MSRDAIEHGLKSKLSFKKIAHNTGFHCTTISKEVLSKRQIHLTFPTTRYHNRCIHRRSCNVTNICAGCYSKSCSKCSKCNELCHSFCEEICPRLSKPPYVCNGCGERHKCVLKKYYYKSKQAHEIATLTRSSSRIGLNITELELKHIDDLVSPLIKKGISIPVICEMYKEQLMISKDTLYRLLHCNALSARNIDAPLIIRRKPRVKKSKILKVDKSCRINRTYIDFLKYIEQYPDTLIIEMDSVIGIRGGKCILTLYFRNCGFMIGYLRDSNDSLSVTAHIKEFSRILNSCGVNIIDLAPILLTDNGSEFSNPAVLEDLGYKVFYCDPGKSYQKGACEKNHEEFRKIYPSGTSFNSLTQANIDQAFSHINSYPRKKLNMFSPSNMFSKLYGNEILSKLNITIIPIDEICLKPLKG